MSRAKTHAEATQDRQIRHADMQAVDYQQALAAIRRNAKERQKGRIHPQQEAKIIDELAALRSFESLAKSIARTRIKADGGHL